jgi:hypothetical protein
MGGPLMLGSAVQSPRRVLYVDVLSKVFLYKKFLLKLLVF